MGQTFQGNLDRTLGIDSRAGSVSFWDTAPPKLAINLGLDPALIVGLHQGQLNLGLNPALKFGAAIAELKDGTKLFFLDRHTGNGELQNVESFRFGPPSQTYYSTEVDFSIPLHQAPFPSVPVYIALPKSIGGYTLKPGQLAVIAGDTPFVSGIVTLPDRKLLVRYAYEVDSASVPIDKAVEWFDIDGNGRIDIAPGSPERGVPNKAAPVFKVDGMSMSLQTNTINLATHTITLKQVPNDTKRITLSAGSRVPDFVYKNFSDESHHLSEIKSKYTLLDFWATWCIPCVADLPFKREAYQRFHDKGFEILGMNGDADKEKAVALLKRLQISWPEAKPDEELLHERFAITAWPTLVLIDGTGKVISTSQSNQLPLSGKDLEQTLAKLLP